MKKAALSVTAAACAALSVAVPDWKTDLQAKTGAYGEIEYEILNATLNQTVSVSGCKPLKRVSNISLELYDDKTFYFGMPGGSPVQGKWTEIPGKSTNTFYLSINRGSLSSLLGEVDKAALGNCKTKYLGMTLLDTLDPTIVLSKNSIVVKVKDSSAKGTLQFKGLQKNNAKGVESTGNIGIKFDLTGTMATPD